MAEEIALTIDGREVRVPRGTLVIRAAEQLGITVPRFCDHPLLDPVGACRQCMVEIEGQGKPMTSCTTQCTDGMVVRTHLSSDLARAAQEAQLEFLLINHPLDCPQCDKGGECPLQDQTLAHGPPDSRFVDHKRRYDKPVPISAQIALDRERCVLCARCTRFSQEISGDPFIELFERGALEQVAIYEDEPYHSYFSGNVVQICPVGALTASSYRFKARPFDVRSTKGICNLCSAGCNLRIDTRRGEIQRQLAATNMAVNEMWNCDKGRFGFEYVAHPDRLGEPAVRNAFRSMEPASWAQAVERAAEGLRAVIDEHGPQAVGVLVGARLTDEDLYAASRFARDVCRTDNVDFRRRPRTAEEQAVLAAVAGGTGPTYEEVEAADVVVVAGLDPEEEVPILHLRLRKAWRKRQQRILAVGPSLGSLAEISWRWLATDAGDEAAVLAALADPDAQDLEEISAALDAAGRVVVLAGERLAESPGALNAAARLATARGAAFAWVPRLANARGAVDAGLLPGLLPGGRPLADAGPVADAWHRLPDTVGMDTNGMLAAAAAGDLKALFCIGFDIARDAEDPRLAAAALERVEVCVVQDLLPNQTTHHADVLLPAMAAPERVGSFTTWEGRRQPFPQSVPPQGLAQEDWDILRQIAWAMGTDLGWETAADVRAEAAPLMEASRPPVERLGDIEAAATEPAVQDRPPEDTFDAVVVDQLLARGDLLTGAKELLETAAADRVLVNAADAQRRGLVGGQRVAVAGPGGEVELEVASTTAVVSGCVVLPRRAGDTPVAVLAEPLAEGGPQPLRVRIEALTSEGRAT